MNKKPILLKDIISLMRNPTSDDIALVTKAHDFVKKAHADQVRFSGEPYFIHLIATAYNLAELGMGATTIAAGFLHDCIEDVGTTPEEIIKEFGEEICFLIEGVTKLGKIRYQGAERHNESLRKLFIATSQDLRVLIIKLADRLHNIQTLQYVRPDKQLRIATETLQIYAPIAYRLGIRKLSRGLEDTAFPYVYPKEYETTTKLLRQKKQETDESLFKFIKSLRKVLANHKYAHIHTDHRIKGVYSLYKKLERKEHDIEKVYDINAIRIVVPKTTDCYQVLGIIHSTWRPLPGRIKDYIAFPKPNGYQSLHTTIFTGDGGIIELQIKTPEMYQESEYGVTSHIAYKASKKEKGYRPNLGWIRHLLPKESNWHNGQTSNIEKPIPVWIKELIEYQKQKKDNNGYEEDLKADFFTERIFVFTPKGDVVDLPLDSTPVDFAYTIHSDIGNHTVGCKINGKYSALNSKLKNGDIVEVESKKTGKPNAKWLEFVKTTIASRHIKNYFDIPHKKPIKSRPKTRAASKTTKDTKEKRK